MTIVYHGSKSLFDKFDYAKMGQNGTSEGYGFYFTDNKTIAQNYAEGNYLYTVELNGKKSLSSDKKTITRAQLKKFIAKLHTTHECGYLWDYGDMTTDGYNNVLNYATKLEYDGNENDVDLIASICNVYGNKEPLQILYNMFGYDHIQVVAEWDHNTEQANNLYIALVNDVITIKNITKL